MLYDSYFIATVIIIIFALAIALAAKYLSGVTKKVVIALFAIIAGGLLYFLYIIENLSTGF